MSTPRKVPNPRKVTPIEVGWALQVPGGYRIEVIDMLPDGNVRYKITGGTYDKERITTAQRLLMFERHIYDYYDELRSFL
jgi:hypothetical protein